MFLKLYARPQIENWLDQAVQMNNWLLVSGLRGVGKTSAVRAWLQKKQVAVKWHTVPRFWSLTELFDLSDEISEESLFRKLNETPGIEVFVWDDFHNLSQKEQDRLLHWLRNHSSQAAHLFISEESHSEQMGFGVPALVMRGLDENEIASFLEAKGIQKYPPVAELFKLTGGMPLLIQLSLQNKALGNLGIFESVTVEEKEMLVGLSVLGKEFQKKQFLEHWSAKKAAHDFDQLTKKLFIESTLTSSEHFLIPPMVRDLALSSCNEKEKQIAAQKILHYLEKTEKQDSISLLSVALAAKNENVATRCLTKIDLANYESLSAMDLRQLLEWLKSDDVQLSSIERVSRLKLHLRILLGQREDGLAEALTALKKMGAIESLSEEGRWFCYDMIHWLHRTGQSEQAQKLLQDLLGRASKDLKLLLRVEQAIPFVRSEPARALEILQRNLSELKGVTLTEREKLTLAQTLYQKATALFSQGNFAESAKEYHESEILFQELKKQYFAAFCLLNICWCQINLANDAQIETTVRRLRESTSQFGFTYLFAGVELLEALILRRGLQTYKAFTVLNTSIENLNKSAPLASRFDAYGEKVRVLFRMGLLSQAEKLLHEMEAIGFDKNGIGRLRIEIGQDQKYLDSILENQNPKDDPANIILAERGLLPVDSPAFETLKKYPLGKLAVFQNQLLLMIKSGEKKGLFQQISEMERFLNPFVDPMPERVALQCLQSQLWDEDEKKLYHLELAELELQRWGADEALKAPLKAVITALKNSQSIEDQTSWKNSRHFEKSRWMLWVIPDQSMTDLVILKTRSGTSKIKEIPATHPGKSVVLIEYLGKVFYKQKAVEDFHRKPILRQCLRLLLQAYPHEVNKSGLAAGIWGEAYSPAVHDARIYTTIQRLRQLLEDDIIENWEGGYRWNPVYDFFYYRKQDERVNSAHKIEVLVIEALRQFHKRGQEWCSRQELVEASGSSDSTVKRILAALVSEGKIVRQGKGPQVRYRLG